MTLLTLCEESLFLFRRGINESRGFGRSRVFVAVRPDRSRYAHTSVGGHEKAVALMVPHR